MGRGRKTAYWGPGLVTAFRRMMLMLLVSIAWFWASALIIMGQDTIYDLKLIDTLYTNIGTNSIDVWGTVFWVVEFPIIIGFSFWAMGLFTLIMRSINGNPRK